MRIMLYRVIAVLLMSFSAYAAAAQDFVGVYLTWGSDPATTMTVNWVDLYPSAGGKCYFRPLAGASQTPMPWVALAARDRTIDPSSMKRRTVDIAGLSPDTVYELVIGRGDREPAVDLKTAFRFRTMPAQLTRPVRFVAGGDMMHSRALLDPMNRQAASLDPDFVIFGGDLAYEDGEKAARVVDFLQSWLANGTAKDRRLLPVIPVIGNHEVIKGYGGTPKEAPYYYGLFVEPAGKPYATYDVGNYLSIIALDSGHTSSIDGEQSQWLDQTLAARTAQRFVFPVYHYPAYGTAKAEAGKTPIEHPRAVMIQRNWVRLFEKYGVSAVLENDHHTFKRTVPIRNNARDDANGIVYLGDGAWGVRVRDVPAPGSAWWLAKAESRNHVWCIDLSPDGSATARAYDATSQVFDEYALPRPRTIPAPSGVTPTN